MLEGFLAIRMEVNENMFEKFSAVRMEVNENIFQGFSMTNQKSCEKQSVSQMIDLVTTIQMVTGSSNLELSSGGKRPFKVVRFSHFFFGQTLAGVQNYRKNQSGTVSDWFPV